MRALSSAAQNTQPINAVAAAQCDHCRAKGGRVLRMTGRALLIVVCRGNDTFACSVAFKASLSRAADCRSRIDGGITSTPLFCRKGRVRRDCSGAYEEGMVDMT